MTTKPYIGITGIVSAADLATVRDCAALMPWSHRLMAGVLVSAKTLREEATTNRRYPRVEHVEGLLAACADAGAWPCVHFNTRAKGDVLATELHALSRYFPSMRGLQLNVVAPDPAMVAAFAQTHPGVEVILQVNRAAMPSLARTREGATYERHVARCDVADEVSAYVARYAKVAHVLLDASGGEGASLDCDLAGTVLGRNGDEWTDRGRRFGVAGGFGPGAADALMGVAGALSVAAGNRSLCSEGRDTYRVSLASLSFDAESGVRVPVADPIPGERYQDRLDADRARAWVSVAAAAVGGAQ